MTFYDHHQSLRNPPRNWRHKIYALPRKKCLTFSLQRRIKNKIEDEIVENVHHFQHFYSSNLLLNEARPDASFVKNNIDII